MRHGCGTIFDEPFKWIWINPFTRTGFGSLIGGFFLGFFPSLAIGFIVLVMAAVAGGGRTSYYD
jgi:hypothetical protein